MGKKKAAVKTTWPIRVMWPQNSLFSSPQTAEMERQNE